MVLSRGEQQDNFPHDDKNRISCLSSQLAMNHLLLSSRHTRLAAMDVDGSMNYPFRISLLM